ncbi:hypothetical protein [Martelella endophytica]|uniref:Transferrin-binding protein B C-lobe/N-lobe beta barrel domain-containing protein n=1 Tax=Martelella endophytica TaxID=1486262 RepID=A0A0D5LK95_MAREN|nr:hypothetical protein [Martelella endophytica]AJY44619.1 hypothetical protein TM49_01265 [Martelella endophytica]
MNKLILAFLAGTAMISLAGCGSTSGGSDGIDISTTGSTGTGNTASGSDGNYTVAGTIVQVRDGSVEATATAGDFTEDEDGNFTLAFTSGPYAGQSVSFSEGNDTSALGDETATLEAFLGAGDDTSSGALYITVGDYEGLNGNFIAAYSGDAVSDLPQSGTGTYNGEYFGSAANDGVTGLVSGNSQIAVDFTSGAVNGTFSGLTITDDGTAIGTMDDVGFSGSLDKTSGTYTASSMTIGGNAADTDSTLSGALYGEGADSTAGSLAVVDDFDNPTKATVGVFQADKAD